TGAWRRRRARSAVVPPVAAEVVYQTLQRRACEKAQNKAPVNILRTRRPKTGAAEIASLARENAAVLPQIQHAKEAAHVEGGSDLARPERQKVGSCRERLLVGRVAHGTAANYQ